LATPSSLSPFASLLLLDWRSLISAYFIFLSVLVWVLPLLFLLHRGFFSPAEVGLLFLSSIVVLMMWSDSSYPTSLGLPFPPRSRIPAPHFRCIHHFLLTKTPAWFPLSFLALLLLSSHPSDAPIGSYPIFPTIHVILPLPSSILERILPLLSSPSFPGPSYLSMPWILPFPSSKYAASCSPLKRPPPIQSRLCSMSQLS
jgi:hypothetical protein